MAKRKQGQRERRMIGRYVVSDSSICHGQPTFRGTRILVADVMEQVAEGTAWEAIVEAWRGNVSADAISEAVRLANEAFRDHSAQYTAPEYVLEQAKRQGDVWNSDIPVSYPEVLDRLGIQSFISIPIRLRWESVHTDAALTFYLRETSRRRSER